MGTERLVKGLTERFMTPQIVGRIGIETEEAVLKTGRAALAMDGVTVGLTPEENQLADQFEEAISSGRDGLEVPGAREAFEKRAKLVEEAIQGA